MADSDASYEEEFSGIVAETSMGLDEGAVVNHTIFIVSYFDAEGQERYAYHTQGDSSVSAILGLVELVKGRMLAEAFGA